MQILIYYVFWLFNKIFWPWHFYILAVKFSINRSLNIIFNMWNDSVSIRVQKKKYLLQVEKSSFLPVSKNIVQI